MSTSKDKSLGDTPPETQALNGASAPAAPATGPAPARFAPNAGYGRPPQGAYRIDPSVLNAGRTRPSGVVKPKLQPTSGSPASPSARAPIPDAPRVSPIYGGSLVPPPRARPAVPPVESRPAGSPAAAPTAQGPASPSAAPTPPVPTAAPVSAAPVSAPAQQPPRPTAPSRPDARVERAALDIPADRVVPRAPEGGTPAASARADRVRTPKTRAPGASQGALTPLLVGAGLVAVLIAIVAVVLMVRGPRKPAAPVVAAPLQAAASPALAEITPADPTVRGLVIPDPSLLPAPARSYNAPPVTTVVAPAPVPIPSRPVPGPAPLAAPPPAAQPAAAEPATLPPPDITVQPQAETPAPPPPAPKPRPSIPVLSDTVPPK